MSIASSTALRRRDSGGCRSPAAEWRLYGDRMRRLLASLAIASLAAACGEAAAPTPTPIPAAASAEEFAAAWCSSLKAMVRAVGNPDTGDDSELSAAFDAAIERGDAAEVQRLAGAMSAELATGRQFATVAAGWEPGSAAASAVDRLLLAFGAKERKATIGRDRWTAAWGGRRLELPPELDRERHEYIVRAYSYS